MNQQLSKPTHENGSQEPAKSGAEAPTIATTALSGRMALIKNAANVSARERRRAALR